MTKRFRLDDLTPEDRRTFRAWVRGVALFYGLVALLLIGIIAARTFLSDPTTAAGPAGTHGKVHQPINGAGTVAESITPSRPTVDEILHSSGFVARLMGMPPPADVRTAADGSVRYHYR